MEALAAYVAPVQDDVKGLLPIKESIGVTVEGLDKGLGFRAGSIPLNIYLTKLGQNHRIHVPSKHRNSLYSNSNPN